ncbi:uncharacterized protein LOC143298327 [Babylonia areolata]|uniref:uncharacterized protein LOC143298327 n=1 Tax=Babylonia areolata TaxID=304850 RepID=UPI003FD11E72
MGLMDEVLNCSIVDEESVKCNGSIYSLPEKRLTYHDKQFWMYIGIYTGLVLFAGLMSGLTMGLLSLDPTTLTTMLQGGTERERRHARRILPLVKRHHLLLVTLLLANAAAVEAMPIFLDRVSDPVTAIVVSVTAVLIFGEVVPQAICTRFGLAIGAALSPLVYVMMALMIVVAWPLSKVLDCILGHDHGTFFRRAQLKVLVDLHGPSVIGDNDGGGGQGSRGSSVAKDDEHLTVDEVLIIKGALDMKYKTARTAMVPISEVYMVSVDSRLDHETMTHIITRGHSRIPVYGGSRSNVIALLLTKTLIKLNPADCTPVAKILQSSTYARPAMFIDDSMPLFDLLNQFQTGRSHLAMVRKSVSPRKQEARGGGGGGGGGDSRRRESDTQPLISMEEEGEEAGEEKDPELVGIITLEDVLEELLQEEIRDESDLETGPEMGGLLQVALAKAASQHRHKLQRCKSQPEDSDRLAESGDSQFGSQMASSQPGQCNAPPVLRRASTEEPLVTFE